MQLNQLWKSSPANKTKIPQQRQQRTNQPCKTCEDTETGVPCGKVLSNDIGAGGKEYFSLMDCPTCHGEKFLYQ